MAKLVLVTEAPATLGKEEFLINEPDFAEEIAASNFKATGRKLTSEIHLKQIVTLIRNKYDQDGELTPAMNKIAFSKYVGLPYNDPADLTAIVRNIFMKYCPVMLDRAVEFSIKNRPAGAKVIFFNGNKSHVPVFFRHGIPLTVDETAVPVTTKKTKTTTVETAKTE